MLANPFEKFERKRFLYYSKDLSVISMNHALYSQMFYKQIILNRGLPFELKIPTAKPVNVAELTKAELNAELEKGYADMVAGRTKSAR